MNLRKLLIVDDEVEILRAISLLLAKYDDHIIYTTSGQSAVEKLKTNDIGMVICDFRMANGDGEFVLNYVLLRHLPVAFYFFTASNIDHFIQHGLITGHLVKPSDFSKLLSLVKDYFKQQDHPKMAP